MDTIISSIDALVTQDGKCIYYGQYKQDIQTHHYPPLMVPPSLLPFPPASLNVIVLTNYLYILHCGDRAPTGFHWVSLGCYLEAVVTCWQQID